MLDLDVVVRARQAEAGGAFQSAARLVIQFSDQRFQVQSHLIYLTKPELCRPDQRLIGAVLAHDTQPRRAGCLAFKSSSTAGTSSRIEHQLHFEIHTSLEKKS